MLPELELGPLTLQTFGICFAAGFLVSGALIARRLRELRKPPDWAYEIAFAALIGGLLGARLHYVIENWGEVSDDLLGNVVSGTGLVWFGGLVGGAAGVLLWARLRGFLERGLLDLCAPALAVGYAIGRLGCQLSGDGDYGKEWDGPWAMAYPNGTVPTTEEVHPTPVYETLTMLGVTYLLWRLRHRMPGGGLFALYLLLGGLERFLIEFIRRNEEVALGLSLARYVALAMIAAGAVWLARLRATPAAATAASARPTPSAARR